MSEQGAGVLFGARCGTVEAEPRAPVFVATGYNLKLKLSRLKAGGKQQKRVVNYALVLLWRHLLRAV